MDKSSAEFKITKARASMVMGNPFFGTLVLRMKMRANEKIRTARTNGKEIQYNPDWINDMKLSQVVAVLAHEVMHTALMHHTRRGMRNPGKWNRAGDHAINNILTDSGFDLPPGCFDPKYKNMSADEIYTLLEDHPSDNEPDPDPMSCGGVDDADKGEGQSQESANKEAEQESKMALAQAAHAAKQAGKLPAGMERLVENILEPVIPWKNVLRRFMTETTMGDYSWNKPNRRVLDQGLYLPAMEEDDPAMQEIVVVVDTSGSIGPQELAEFGAEIRAIHEDIKPLKTHVIYCDAAVNRVDIFERDDAVELIGVGGGGTDFRPPFDYVEEKRIPAKCLVYLTDGYGSFPEEPTFPTLWAMTTDVQPPFGQVVQIK